MVFMELKRIFELFNQIVDICICSERKGKIDDIRKNIRDAILVSPKPAMCNLVLSSQVALSQIHQG